MRFRVGGALLVLGLITPALGGITITSYQTVALTNAFAPLSQDQYFAKQTLLNVSPAIAQVSGDWMGPNAGSSTNTWHWIGSAQISMTTQFDPSNLTIAGSGSFAHELTTTPEFIDPRSSTIYTPASGVDYSCSFTLDEPALYNVDVQLNQWGSISLASVGVGFVFNRINFSATPVLISQSEFIPAGSYAIRANASVGAPNFPNGAFQYSRSGSFENLTFILQVPEPSTLGAVTMIMMKMIRRRTRRCARAN